jgi:hypothetical protein
MDHFGIGNAMRGMVQMVIHAGRRTGRTTSLLDSLKNGDRIVFADRAEANRVERLCKERRLSVECIVILPCAAYKIAEREKSIGRTVFDHGWIEQFYDDAIDRAANAIDQMQEEKSGTRDAYKEARRPFEGFYDRRF